MKLTGNTLYSN